MIITNTIMQFHLDKNSFVQNDKDQSFIVPHQRQISDTHERN